LAQIDERCQLQAQVGREYIDLRTRVRSSAPRKRVAIDEPVLAKARSVWPSCARAVAQVNVFATNLSLELAPFIDLGKVFARTGKPLSHLHKGGGIGVRAVASPFIVGFVDVGFGPEGPPCSPASIIRFEPRLSGYRYAIIDWRSNAARRRLSTIPVAGACAPDFEQEKLGWPFSVTTRNRSAARRWFA